MTQFVKPKLLSYSVHPDF